MCGRGTSWGQGTALAPPHRAAWSQVFRAGGRAVNWQAQQPRWPQSQFLRHGLSVRFEHSVVSDAQIYQRLFDFFPFLKDFIIYL